jgi:site-specific recombinase XerD
VDPKQASAGDQSAPSPPRLLDALRHAIRVRHYSIRTEEAYVDWARRFVRFHGRRHPRELGAPEVAAFLTHLAVDRTVAPSTQNQARSALMFLHRDVLQLELPWLQEVVAAKHPAMPRAWGWQWVFPSAVWSADPLGHADVSTTMIYTHVLNRGGRGVRSPLDQM